MSSPILSALLLLGPFGVQHDEELFGSDRLHGTPEIQQGFATLAQRHPRFFRSGSLGTSVRGRAIPLLEVTDLEARGEKHGFWIDAAIHGHELASAELVLAFAEELRRRIACGEPPGFLQRVEIFLVPVLNVDARELCIVQPFPPQRVNLQPVDDDGDGTADEDGPVDLNGDGYHSLQEFCDQDSDGRCGEDRPGGVDLNRDFPVCSAERAPGWQPQPETLAVVRFWEQHQNLALAVSYHGGSAQTETPTLFLWPPVAMAEPDAARFSELFRIYERHCAGQEWNTLQDPGKYGSISPLVGTSMEWFFAERGALAFTVEVELRLRDLWTSDILRDTVAHDCAGSVRVPRVSAEVRERSIGSALTPLAQRHTEFLLALAERLPFE